MQYLVRYIKKLINPVVLEYPWMSFAAIAKLLSILEPHWRVFEYGCGGSTLCIAKRVKSVQSVEHEKKFYLYFEDILSKKGVSNVNLKLIEPVLIDDSTASREFVSGFEGYEQYEFKDYVEYIQLNEDESLDLVLIDGRSRSACALLASAKVKLGGYLILDDSERERYAKVRTYFDESDHWEHYLAKGYSPFKFGSSETSFFKRIK